MSDFISFIKFTITAVTKITLRNSANLELVAALILIHMSKKIIPFLKDSKEISLLISVSMSKSLRLS